MDQPAQTQPPVSGIEPLLVSVNEAARILGVSPWSCYKLLRDGKIDSRHIGSRRMVKVESLREYVAGRA